MWFDSLLQQMPVSGRNKRQMETILPAYGGIATFQDGSIDISPIPGDQVKIFGDSLRQEISKICLEAAKKRRSCGMAANRAIVLVDSSVYVLFD